MGQTSKIQWTEATWNPWRGCHKVSAGCKYCYMFRTMNRWHQDGNVPVRSKTTFRDPLKWKEPKLIFTCSMSDWFVEEADEWRPEAWDIIRQTPHHTYQILTKRPERILECLPGDWGDGWPNVWLGVSVEDQQSANTRIPLLLMVPAVVHYLSCEPLLSAVDLAMVDQNKHFWLPDPAIPGATAIDWVIIGGESGNESGPYRYRKMHPDWVMKLMDQCAKSSVPVFVKQLGTYQAKIFGLKDRHGGDMDEWPENLQVRQMPETYYTLK